jgi:hypothetical protein
MEKLKREHFIQAAHYIRQNSIPVRRGPRTWVVRIDGINCPVKFILSVARYISGDTNEISSGN